MNEQNRNSIRITGHTPGSPNKDEPKSEQKLDLSTLKKPLIFFLMALVCAGCLYLIFKPKEQNLDDEKGINVAIPQASEDKLQADKQKAYEQQLLEKKNQEQKNGLTSLSDYWNEENKQPDTGRTASQTINSTQNPAVQSYKAAQQTLGSFYGRDEQEVSQLKREVSRLRNELVQKEVSVKPSGINDQLELMERSYQMAAKYLPSGQGVVKNQLDSSPNDNQKVKLTYAGPARMQVVSKVYREPADSSWIGTSGARFFATESQDHDLLLKSNAVKAVIPETKVIRPDEQLSLRLLQPMLLGKITVPTGTLLRAAAKFQGSRLQLKISSIEYKGSIEPVEINIYDNDGQLGLNIPFSSEQNAVTDIVANMGQSSGTSVMLTSSTGQQVASDLSRGMVQGLSGYFQKKVRSPKVTVKAGHQVYLLSKK
ncbi:MULTISPECIES: conjugative transposon protein TraM [Chryseobacterium]|uniref:conjugative transposon protein TraM n=1 Tax=Chryseobacterium TaxID=59732 RepID=UPI00162528DE|nr:MULTISPECIES: conjugative transposon protein TraM [Chryseobacterium]MBF6643944.1 conjugative transposon protein TraM [Chryseobacterium indologenes]MBU3046810.1 conjugative transposon protein TraM [Chryseobacterium indologenes]QQQ72329.1 conjugative transposon protein TraM [Chryseobacterium indologenes]